MVDVVVVGAAVVVIVVVGADVVVTVVDVDVVAVVPVAKVGGGVESLHAVTNSISVAATAHTFRVPIQPQISPNNVLASISQRPPGCRTAPRILFATFPSIFLDQAAAICRMGTDSIGRPNGTAALVAIGGADADANAAE